MKTKDILLVDDDIDYLYLLGMLLKAEVITVSDGFKALEVLRIWCAVHSNRAL